MEKLHLTVISPQERVFEGDVSGVTLPGTLGAFTILPQHAPIISSLEKGIISFSAIGESEAREVEIDGGFVEMSDDKVTVCIC